MTDRPFHHRLYYPHMYPENQPPQNWHSAFPPNSPYQSHQQPIKYYDNRLPVNHYDNRLPPQVQSQPQTQIPSWNSVYDDRNPNSDQLWHSARNQPWIPTGRSNNSRPLPVWNPTHQNMNIANSNLPPQNNTTKFKDYKMLNRSQELRLPTPTEQIRESPVLNQDQNMMTIQSDSRFQQQPGPETNTNSQNLIQEDKKWQLLDIEQGSDDENEKPQEETSKFQESEIEMANTQLKLLENNSKNRYNDFQQPKVFSNTPYINHPTLDLTNTKSRSRSSDSSKEERMERRANKLKKKIAKINEKRRQKSSSSNHLSGNQFSSILQNDFELLTPDKTTTEMLDKFSTNQNQKSSNFNETIDAMPPTPDISDDELILNKSNDEIAKFINSLVEKDVLEQEQRDNILQLKDYQKKFDSFKKRRKRNSETQAESKANDDEEKRLRMALLEKIAMKNLGQPNNQVATATQSKMLKKKKDKKKNSRPSSKSSGKGLSKKDRRKIIKAVTNDFDTQELNEMFETPEKTKKQMNKPDDDDSDNISTTDMSLDFSDDSCKITNFPDKMNSIVQISDNSDSSESENADDEDLLRSNLLKQIKRKRSRKLNRQSQRYEELIKQESSKLNNMVENSIENSNDEEIMTSKVVLVNPSFQVQMRDSSTTNTSHETLSHTNNSTPCKSPEIPVDSDQDQETESRTVTPEIELMDKTITLENNTIVEPESPKAGPKNPDLTLDYENVSALSKKILQENEHVISSLSLAKKTQAKEEDKIKKKFQSTDPLLLKQIANILQQQESKYDWQNDGQKNSKHERVNYLQNKKFGNLMERPLEMTENLMFENNQITPIQRPVMVVDNTGSSSDEAHFSEIEEEWGREEKERKDKEKQQKMLKKQRYQPISNSPDSKIAWKSASSTNTKSPYELGYLNNKIQRSLASLPAQQHKIRELEAFNQLKQQQLMMVQHSIRSLEQQLAQHKLCEQEFASIINELNSKMIPKSKKDFETKKRYIAYNKKKYDEFLNNSNKDINSCKRKIYDILRKGRSVIAKKRKIYDSCYDNYQNMVKKELVDDYLVSQVRLYCPVVKDTGYKGYASYTRMNKIYSNYLVNSITSRLLCTITNKINSLLENKSILSQVSNLDLNSINASLRQKMLRQTDDGEKTHLLDLEYSKFRGNTKIRQKQTDQILCFYALFGHCQDKKCDFAHLPTDETELEKLYDDPKNCEDSQKIYKFSENKDTNFIPLIEETTTNRNTNKFNNLRFNLREIFAKYFKFLASKIIGELQDLLDLYLMESSPKFEIDLDEGKSYRYFSTTSRNSINESNLHFILNQKSVNLGKNLPVKIKKLYRQIYSLIRILDFIKNDGNFFNHNQKIYANDAYTTNFSNNLSRKDFDVEFNYLKISQVQEKKYPILSLALNFLNLYKNREQIFDTVISSCDAISKCDASMFSSHENLEHGYFENFKFMGSVNLATLIAQSDNVVKIEDQKKVENRPNLSKTGLSILWSVYFLTRPLSLLRNAHVEPFGIANWASFHQSLPNFIRENRIQTEYLELIYNFVFVYSTLQSQTSILFEQFVDLVAKNSEHNISSSFYYRIVLKTALFQTKDDGFCEFLGEFLKVGDFQVGKNQDEVAVQQESREEGETTTFDDEFDDERQKNTIAELLRIFKPIELYSLFIIYFYSLNHPELKSNLFKAKSIILADVKMINDVTDYHLMKNIENVEELNCLLSDIFDHNNSNSHSHPVQILDQIVDKLKDHSPEILEHWQNWRMSQENYTFDQNIALPSYFANIQKYYNKTEQTKSSLNRLFFELDDLKPVDSNYLSTMELIFRKFQVSNDYEILYNFCKLYELDSSVSSIIVLLAYILDYQQILLESSESSNPEQNENLNIKNVYRNFALKYPEMKKNHSVQKMENHLVLWQFLVVLLGLENPKNKNYAFDICHYLREVARKNTKTIDQKDNFYSAEKMADLWILTLFSSAITTIKAENTVLKLEIGSSVDQPVSVENSSPIKQMENLMTVIFQDFPKMTDYLRNRLLTAYMLAISLLSNYSISNCC